jgi:hypothetical protein
LRFRELHGVHCIGLSYLCVKISNAVIVATALVTKWIISLYVSTPSTSCPPVKWSGKAVRRSHHTPISGRESGFPMLCSTSI